jgi:hypothetical protein
MTTLDIVESASRRRRQGAGRIRWNRRDETSLDALTAAMLQVVDETLEPEFVGPWLREPSVDKVTR